MESNQHHFFFPSVCDSPLTFPPSQPFCRQLTLLVRSDIPGCGTKCRAREGKWAAAIPLSRYPAHDSPENSGSSGWLFGMAGGQPWREETQTAKLYAVLDLEAFFTLHFQNSLSSIQQEQTCFGRIWSSYKRHTGTQICLQERKTRQACDPAQRNAKHLYLTGNQTVFLFG